MGGISIWQLLILLVIVVLLFGTKRLRNLGSDMGSAVKGFKNSMGDSDKADEAESDKEGKPDSQLSEHKNESHKTESDRSETDSSRK